MPCLMLIHSYILVWYTAWPSTVYPWPDQVPMNERLQIIHAEALSSWLWPEAVFDEN